MATRREFIKISSLASASLFLPKFLKTIEAKSFFAEGAEGRKLVVVQLSGGNDGLNTVVPFRNDIYYKSRPTIGLNENDLLLLSDQIGLNKSLLGFKAIYDDGGMSIINGVGYPNPDRSHFRSMDIWQTASNSNEVYTTGWIGRYLDANCKHHNHNSAAAIEVDDTLSLALKGEQLKGMAVKDPQRLYFTSTDPYFKSRAQSATATATNLDYLVKTMVETVENAQYIHSRSKIYKSKIDYPNTTLGKDFKTIAELIISGIDTKVFYLSHGSFDTHVNELEQQGRLLKELGDATAAFVKDLKDNSRFNDVLLMTFSEFGRRVAQNASGGTDHGTANNIFVVGGALKKPGVYNPMPDLAQLQDGDLTHEIDFRQVYATVLSNWLKSDPSKILFHDYQKLAFI